jgi:hypothetical protein
MKNIVQFAGPNKITKKGKMKLTHKKLTELAKNWLKNAKQCNPVFAEKGCANFSEIPDAIGFKCDLCIVVECKTSKSDLYADRKKPFRESGGLGDLRYYFMEMSLYEECKDFDFNGWGVVVVTDIGVVKKLRGIDSQKFESNLKNERDFLRSRILEIQKFGS